MKRGKRLATLVTRINGPLGPTAQGYRYQWFCRINWHYKSPGCICIALAEDRLPFAVGDLIVLKYWHKDIDGEHIWEVVDD